MPAIPNVRLVTASVGAGKMALRFQALHVRLRRTAIITGEYDEGVVGHARLVECGEDFANSPIGFHDKVAVFTQAAFALPFR
jgi:hypothetical protein